MYRLKPIKLSFHQAYVDTKLHLRFYLDWLAGLCSKIDSNSWCEFATKSLDWFHSKPLSKFSWLPFSNFRAVSRQNIGSGKLAVS